MPRLSRPATVAYSAGQFAAGLYFAFNTFILSLYLSQFTQNNILIGWLSSTRSFEQSVTQPIVGVTSDRIWTRVGRRVPFFLIAMPIVAVLLIFNGLLPVPANPTDPAHLWLVVVTIFLFSLIFNIGIDASSLALAVSFMLLIMQLLWAAPCGWLGDRFGKKNIFALGLLVMGVSALFSAFATTIPQILFFLIFLAFGNTAQTVLFGVYLADLIPAERVGEFSGLSATAETGGVFLSIVVAGALINLNAFGLQYRLILILTGVFLLLSVIAVSFVKPRLTAVVSASAAGT